MVKKRTNKPASNVADFIRGAQSKHQESDASPDAPRKYKTIGLQFNRYEYEQLEAATNKSKRTKNSIIREGIEKIVDEIISSS